MTMLVMGTSLSGIELVGPFKNHSEAVEFMTDLDDKYEVAQVQSPAAWLKESYGV